MLGDYQQALALLLVDPRLRERLRLDPVALELEWNQRGLDLSDEETTSLHALDPKAVERCARGLLAKRRSELVSALPYTAQLWPGFGPSYVELLTEAPATSASFVPTLGPALSELVRLRAPLVALARRDPLPPPWLPALLELELDRACARRDGCERALVCDYPVHVALTALDQGWRSCTLEPTRSAYRVGPEALRWRPVEDSR